MQLKSKRLSEISKKRRDILKETREEVKEKQKIKKINNPILQRTIKTRKLERNKRVKRDKINS